MDYRLLKNIPISCNKFGLFLDDYLHGFSCSSGQLKFVKKMKVNLTISSAKVCDIAAAAALPAEPTFPSSLFAISSPFHPMIISAPPRPPPPSSSSLSSSFLVSSNSSPLLAHIWREIQGSNNWENLMEPLNPILRDEIIRYGEFVVACYEAFDLDPGSETYLKCKYGKNNIMEEVGLGNSGYTLTKYIYATPDLNVFPMPKNTSFGRWIGYVAVSNDEESRRLGRRDVLFTFRGTVTNPEWIANLMSSLTPARLDPHEPRPEVMVEAGFLSLYTSRESHCKFGLVSCREQLLSEVSRLLRAYKGEEMSISLAGHSMGSSLALLLAYDIVELGLNRDTGSTEREIPVTVFSFGGPRVGNIGFKNRCEELGLKVLRIVNINDPITKLPGFFFNENSRVLVGGFEYPWSYSCYAHVGVELLLDFFKMHKPSCVHDLATYISLLKCPRSNIISSKHMALDLVSSVQNFITSMANFFHHHHEELDEISRDTICILAFSLLLKLVDTGGPCG